MYPQQQSSDKPFMPGPGPIDLSFMPINFGQFGGFSPYGQFGGFNPYGQLGGFGGFSPYGQFGGLGNLFGGASPYNDLFASFQTKLDDLFKNYQTNLVDRGGEVMGQGPGAGLVPSSKPTTIPQQLEPVISENSATPKPATGKQKSNQPRVPNTQYGASRFPNGIKTGAAKPNVQYGGSRPRPAQGITPAVMPGQPNAQIGSLFGSTSSVAR